MSVIDKPVVINRVSEMIEVGLDDLINLQGNLKSLSKTAFEKFKSQLIENGFTSPVHAWRDEKGKLKILDGHQRTATLKLMREEGIILPEKFKVVVINAEDEKRARKILLGLTAQYGKMSDESLSDFAIESEIDLDWINTNIELPFDSSIDELLEGESGNSGQCDPDEVPETPINTRSKLGDLYEFGAHRLLCGDSTKLEDVERLMNGDSPDLISTDPPYGMDLETDRSNMGNTTTKYNKIIGDSEPYDPSFIFGLFKDTPKILWGADYYCHRISVWSEGSPIVWAKAHSDDENKVWGSSFETAWVWPKKKRLLWFIRRIHMGSEHEGTHPTQKPTEITTRAIEMFGVKNGGIILDFYGGSGSTLIACEKTNRKCYMMELDPHYVDVIVSRWCKFTGTSEVTRNGEKIQWS